MYQRERNNTIKAAVRSLKRQLHELSVHANLYDEYGLDVPATRKASAERRRLRTYVRLLEKIGKEHEDGDRD